MNMIPYEKIKEIPLFSWVTVLLQKNEVQFCLKLNISKKKQIRKKPHTIFYEDFWFLRSNKKW